MSAIKVFEDYYALLVQSLPMDDTIFIAKLYSKHLLPGNLKSTLQSLPTSADKAAMMLDQAIEPFMKINDIIPLKKLLTIMEDSGMKNLAKSIRSALNQMHESSSSDTGELC